MRRNKAYLKTHKCQSLGHAAHGRYGTPFASKLRYLTEVTNLTMSFFANQKCRDINKASWIGSRISLHDADMYYLLNKGILLAIMPHFKKRGFPMEDWCTNGQWRVRIRIGWTFRSNGLGEGRVNISQILLSAKVPAIRGGPFGSVSFF